MKSEHVYGIEICKLIEMKRYGKPLFWYDKSGIEHLDEITATQFIETSNIVVHALNKIEKVFINIFSCKYFNTDIATDFTKRFFGAKEYKMSILDRK